MRRIKILLCALAAVILVALLAGCAPTVTFDANGGTLVEGKLVQKVKSDSSAIPPQLEKEGYVLSGWEGSYVNPTDDVTVKAVWKPLYTVTFDANGGAAADEALLSQSVAEGDSATPPELVRDGYVFDGWDGEPSAVTADITVVAKWKRLYTVTYNLDGGTTSDTHLLSQVIVDGDHYSAPKVTKTNSKLVSWEKKQDEEKGTIEYTAIWKKTYYDANEMYELLNPATVEVTSYRKNGIKMSLGSGFFIDASGTLVTNFHVIEEAYDVRITTSDGKEYPIVQVVAYDREKDIAILRASVDKCMSYLALSAESPRNGDVVYAMGSSLGLTGTFSSGIVSFADRKFDGVSFVQTTAPISSGNSGGPLVNSAGEVIGVNTSSFSAGQNLNLSVSASVVASLDSVNISMTEFFIREVVFQDYVGEQVVAETELGDSAQGVENGYTVEGRLVDGDDADAYLTRVSGANNRLVVIFQTEDAYDLLYSAMVIIASKEGNFHGNALVADEAITDSYNAYYLEGLEGKYMCLIVIEPSEQYYNSGYAYYGALLMSLSGGDFEYEYFAYNMDEPRYEKFMKYILEEE